MEREVESLGAVLGFANYVGPVPFFIWGGPKLKICCAKALALVEWNGDLISGGRDSCRFSSTCIPPPPGNTPVRLRYDLI